MKKIFILLLATLAFLLPSKVSATHMMGSDITYTCVKEGVFKIQIKVYRDCRGVPFSFRSGENRIRCVSSNASINFMPTRTSIKDITPVCASAAKRCNPPNTGFGQEGIEEHTYEITIDFNKAPYSNFKNCCEIRIESGQCCRNGAITTGAANQNFFTYATIDLCKAKCNNSPNLTTEPIAYLCCDQPFFFNNGATDFEGDSISYAFADPLRGWNQAIGYNSGYAKDIPFDVYFPPRRKHPYNNPNSDPPEGIYLDPETGDLIFTPTNCNETTVLTLEMKEWRKDSTGKWEVISITRRDIQMVVRQCPGNNPPQIKGNNNYSVCAGSQICFKISTDDRAYVPPPPLPRGKDDTVTLTWNRGIPGATFKVIDPTARLQEAEFCWTPKKEDARSLPYQFTATARDDACPLNAVTVRAFRIRVKQIAEATVDIDTLDCGRYSINAMPIDGFEGTPDYTWTLRDSNSKVILNPKTARFISNNFYRSTLKSDTIKFGKGGKYIIQLDLNNLGVNCPNVYLDTIVVPEQLEVNLSFGRDTFVCDKNELELRPIITNAFGSVKFKWFTPVKHNPKDTLDHLKVNLYTPDSLFFVEIIDSSGCVDGDSIRVFLRNNPNVILPPDRRLCPEDEVLLTMQIDTAFWLNPFDSTLMIQGDTFTKEWTLNGNLYSTEDSITISTRGQYVVTITDSVGCQDTDTFTLFVNEDFIADAGDDKTICWGDTAILTSSYSKGTYEWFDLTANPKTNVGIKDTLRIRLQSNKEFELLLTQTEDTVSCYRKDTVDVFVNALPVLTMPENLTLCCDAGLISLQVSARAEPAGGVWSCRENPSLVSLNQFNTEAACNPISKSVYTLIYTYIDISTGCVNKDSITATVNPLPRVELEDYIFACQDQEEVILNDYVVRPINQSLGRATWDDLPGQAQVPVFYNAGTTLLPDYRLRVSEPYWNMVNDNTDTTYLVYYFTNGDGCTNTDTIPVYINKVPVISFGTIDDVCEGYGLLSLNNHTSVFPVNGEWECIDTNGFSPCSNVVWGDEDTLDVTLGATQPGTYYLRYNLSGNCNVSRDTFITINPIPNVNIESSTYINGGLTIRPDRQICETDGDLRLNAMPIGGLWSTDLNNNFIFGSRFLTNNAPKNQLITIYYTYINPVTGCMNIDTTDITVQEMPMVKIITPEYDLCRSSDLSIEYEAEYSNTTGITWFITPTDDAQIIDNKANPTNIVFNTSNDTTHQFIVIAQTEPGDACPATSAVKLVRIHPVPDANIILTDTFGCQPLQTEMSVNLSNHINLDSATYVWDIDGEIITNLTNPAIMIEDPGTYDISLQLTSKWGCDTIISTPVTIYPNPVAIFEPIPKSTTVALPKFNFNNNSYVNPILNSSIVNNIWNFGDPLTTDDTSSNRNSVWYYNTIDTGTYQISLIVVTNHGCKDSTYSTVHVQPDIIVYIPNAFTPDISGPTKNNKFRVVASGFKTFEIIIFNRWGEKLYETTDITQGWDGNYMGMPCQVDVYAYLARFTNFSGEEFIYDGTFTLIR